MKRRDRGGFTLIELLVVVAIIGILAAIIVPRISQALTTARQGRSVARLDAIRTGANLYFLDHGVDANDEMANYPWNLGQLFHYYDDGTLAGCSCGACHYYLEGCPRDYAEEVGDGAAGGSSWCNWCDANASHNWCKGRGVQSVTDPWTPTAYKGGWNWCVPNGTDTPTAPPLGTVWIDEDCIMLGGKRASEY